MPPGLLKPSGIMCINGGPLREGMKAPTILHGLSHIGQATISRDLSSQPRSIETRFLLTILHVRFFLIV